MQYGFYFDGTRCTGCKTCVLACKDKKNLAIENAFRQVYEYETAGGFTQDSQGCWTCSSKTYYVSSACNHCSEPACMVVCPVAAIIKDADTGLVYVDEKLCTGCGSCASACPYHAPQVYGGVAIKCDGCRDRVAEGKSPVCVEACIGRALEFGDIEELRNKYGMTVAIAPLPDPTTTMPSVCIKPPYNAVGWNTADGGAVVNSLEVR